MILSHFLAERCPKFLLRIEERVSENTVNHGAFILSLNYHQQFNSFPVAIRVLRAATELGWSTISVYTEGDESHTTFSNEAIKLDDVSDYLNVGRMVDIAVG